MSHENKSTAWLTFFLKYKKNCANSEFIKYQKRLERKVYKKNM